MAADLVTIGVVSLYFLGMLAIGAWASKKIKIPRITLSLDGHLDSGCSYS
jgi:hypothetical protein